MKYHRYGRPVPAHRGFVHLAEVLLHPHTPLHRCEWAGCPRWGCQARRNATGHRSWWCVEHDPGVLHASRERPDAS